MQLLAATQYNYTLTETDPVATAIEYLLPRSGTVIVFTLDNVL